MILLTKNQFDEFLKIQKFKTAIEVATILNTKYQLNLKASQIKSLRKNHHVRSGLTGRFEKGHVSANKGKHIQTKGRMAETQFKKGHIPANHKPVGSERISHDGYIEVKVAEGINQWKLKHRIIWEEKFGKIPPNMVLIFLDNDKTNCCIDNLKLVSRQVNVRMNQAKLRFNEKELTETGIVLAEVLAAKGKRKETTK